MIVLKGLCIAMAVSVVFGLGLLGFALFIKIFADDEDKK